MTPIPTYKYVEKRAGKRGYYITYEGVRISKAFKTKRLAKIAMAVSLLDVDIDFKPKETYTEIKAQGDTTFGTAAEYKSNTKRLWMLYSIRKARLLSKAAKLRK